MSRPAPRTRPAKVQEWSARLALRREKGGPIWDEMKSVLDEAASRIRNVILPKSPLGRALQYMRNHWGALRRYLDDGCLPIDNNDVEHVDEADRDRLQELARCGERRGRRMFGRVYHTDEQCGTERPGRMALSCGHHPEGAGRLHGRRTIPALELGGRTSAAHSPVSDSGAERAYGTDAITSSGSSGVSREGAAGAGMSRSVRFVFRSTG